MKPTIMIVDDEPEICGAVNSYLTRRGYRVVTAHSGEEAIAKLLTVRPLLVLLDIRMPGMDGLECLRKIKELNNRVLVVMITCVTDVDTAREALKFGAADYITKPCSLEVIERAVSVFLFINTDPAALEHRCPNPWASFYRQQTFPRTARHSEHPLH